MTESGARCERLRCEAFDEILMQKVEGQKSHVGNVNIE